MNIPFGRRWVALAALLALAGPALAPAAHAEPTTPATFQLVIVHEPPQVVFDDTHVNVVLAVAATCPAAVPGQVHVGVPWATCHRVWVTLHWLALDGHGNLTEVTRSAVIRGGQGSGAVHFVISGGDVTGPTLTYWITAAQGMTWDFITAPFVCGTPFIGWWDLCWGPGGRHSTHASAGPFEVPIEPRPGGAQA